MERWHPKPRGQVSGSAHGTPLFSQQVSNWSAGCPSHGGESTQQVSSRIGNRASRTPDSDQQVSNLLGCAGREGIRDHVRRFRDEHALIAFLEEHVGQGALKRVAATNGGEWAGPCPVCGGDDRLRAWPDPREGNPRAWCRQCGRAGDVLDWAAWIDGRDPQARGAVVQTLRDAGQLGAEQPTPRRAAQITSAKPPIPLSNSAARRVRDCADLAPPGDIAEWPADAREHFEERAAIMEYDGGLTRAEAERRAAAEVRLTERGVASAPGAAPPERFAQPVLARTDRTADAASTRRPGSSGRAPERVQHEDGRSDSVCLSCSGKRFVSLSNGRRSVCLGCERPPANEILGEDDGVIGGQR